jgi:hypothetical protein
LASYRLYGLQVAADEALPGLPESGNRARAEVAVHIGTLPVNLDLVELRKQPPRFTSSVPGPAGGPSLQVWHSSPTGYYCFEYCEGFRFVIDDAGRSIWTEWTAPVTLEDITAFLLGQIFAFALHLRGYVCLHASAVAVQGQAVLFAGEPGMGKSSTAAAFVERGFGLLADDVAAIRREGEGRWVVAPGFPLLRLWPDSAEFLYGAAAARELPRAQPGEDKRLLGLGRSPGKFQSEPTPLGGIYLLAPRSAETTAPRSEKVEDAEGLLQLLASGYVSLTLGAEQRAEEFRLLGEIFRSVPVRSLTPSADPRLLGKMCKLVVEDLRQGKTPVAGSRP